MNFTIVPFKGPDGDDGGGQCELLGPFALLVQGALGLLALSSLVFKRWRERPQRPLKIWFFDVSKQVVGSVLVHIANLVMAMFSSGTLPGSDDDNGDPHPHPPVHSPEEDSKYHPNPCSFYLLNLLIDTTIGIVILIYTLRIITKLCQKMPSNYSFSHGITSGDYGNPPKVRNWLKQSLIYFAGLLIMKFVVLTIFSLAPWLGRVGDWALRWTEGNRKVQIAFVMFIFPLIMNAIQYYIIDTFIKKQEQKGEITMEEGEERDSNEPEIQPSSAAAVASRKDGNDTQEDEDEDEDESSGDEGGSATKSSLKQQKENKSKSTAKTKIKPVHDYDPDKDGDQSMQSSSSSEQGKIKLVDNT